MAHRLAELRYLIRSWDTGNDRFAEIIECAVAVWPGALDDLADDLRVTQSTIRRWSRNTSLPPLMIRKRIVDKIRQKLLA